MKNILIQSMEKRRKNLKLLFFFFFFLKKTLSILLQSVFLGVVTVNFQSLYSFRKLMPDNINQQSSVK
jgi:hypothetical protein